MQSHVQNTLFNVIIVSMWEEKNLAIGGSIQVKYQHQLAVKKIQSVLSVCFAHFKHLCTAELNSTFMIKSMQLN